VSEVNLKVWINLPALAQIVLAIVAVVALVHWW
jgi:hypothetical protein